ncbi:MAG: serine/threonine protein kinase [bacterium]|nr:serine/threonine protein kinase [bacterium]
MGLGNTPDCRFGYNGIMVPERIGPYHLHAQLGAGGMGVVYRAFDERLNRAVAIKLVPTEATEARAQARFRREALVVAQLNHPAIVQIFDLMEWGHHTCIVMELVEGRTLEELLAEGPLAVGHGLSLAREITDALAHAHAKGIVHRDLKPANVMVTPAGYAKILDFGIAKLLHHSVESEITAAGVLMGTFSYMSPEQVTGVPIDHRSDLFSLGTLLYQTFTGQGPFLGQGSYAILAKVVMYPHLPACELNPELPEELSTLIDRLLEKNPERRPQSAEEVMRILDAVEKTMGVEVRFGRANQIGMVEEADTIDGLVEAYESALRRQVRRRTPTPQSVDALSVNELIHLLHQRLAALRSSRILAGS